MDRTYNYEQFFTFLRGHPLPVWASSEDWQPPDLDFSRQCTSEETGRECWLCFELPPWNCVLNPLGLNLSETTPGRLELVTFKPVDSLRFVSPHNKQAWCSVFFLAWLPRKHRCIQLLAVRRDLPCVPYSVWQLASEARKFGAGTRCHLRHVVWKTYSEHWGVLEFFPRYAALETLQVSFELNAGAVIPDELRELIRLSAHTLKAFSISMSSQHDACERLTELDLCHSLADLDITLPGATSAPQTIARILSSKSCALHKLSFFYPPYSVGDRAFADALRANSTLFEVCIGSPSVEAFGVVCDALTENASVKKLSLGRRLTQGEMTTPDDKIALLLRRNAVLESLTLADFRFFADSPESIASALADNAVLKFLTCTPGNMLSSVVSQLAAALERNKTLQRILLDAIVGPREHKRALAALVESLECSHRLQVERWENDDLLTMLPLLVAPLATPRDVWLVVDDIVPEAASALRAALAGPDGAPVGKLTLDSVRRWPQCVKDAVKDILVSNSSLQSLEITEDIRYFELGAYCQDLAEVSSAVWRSSNLSHLTILSADHLDRAEYAEWLVAVLRNSKSIISLSVFQQLQHYSAERAFDVMAMGLLLNSFVVEIDIDGPVQDSKDYIFSRTVTRNRTRVNDAARFVTGTDSSPRCARAFEVLHTKQSLLRLMTWLTRRSEKDARAEIRAALGRMREDFLRFAGVVKSAVKCWPANVTQIDALNADCWRAISCYLKLHDVCVRQ